LECVEYFYRENMTDGLLVVPPTEQRVQQFLDAVPGELVNLPRIALAVQSCGDWRT